jgi:hypothetical protein
VNRQYALTVTGMGQPPPWIEEYLYDGQRFRLVADDQELWRIFLRDRYIGAVIGFPILTNAQIAYMIDLPGKEGAAGISPTNDWHTAVEHLIRRSDSGT